MSGPCHHRLRVHCRLLPSSVFAFCIALCVFVGAGPARGADICVFIQAAERDLAFPETRLTDRPTAEARAREAEAMAAAHTASDTHILWIADSYRALALGHWSDALAARTVTLVERLRADHAECRGDADDAGPGSSTTNAEQGNEGRGAAGGATPAARGEAADIPPSALGGILAVFALGGGAFWVYWRRVLRHERAERFPCHIAAQLKLGQQDVHVIIQDITEFGAKLRLEERGLSNGVRVDLRCALFEAGARVRWANGAYAGIAFDKSLPQAVLEAAKGAELPDIEGGALIRHA